MILNKYSTMKRFLVLMALLPILYSGRAQQNDINSTSSVTRSDAVVTPYTIIPTIYATHSIKFDTRTGRIWMIKYNSIQKPVAKSITYALSEVCLSGVCLSEPSNDNIGRFDLIPSFNPYNLIIFDKWEGQVFHVVLSSDFNSCQLIPVSLSEQSSVTPQLYSQGTVVPSYQPNVPYAQINSMPMVGQSVIAPQAVVSSLPDAAVLSPVVSAMDTIVVDSVQVQIVSSDSVKLIHPVVREEIIPEESEETSNISIVESRQETKGLSYITTVKVVSSPIEESSYARCVADVKHQLRTKARTLGGTVVLLKEITSEDNYRKDVVAVGSIYRKK